MPFWFTRALTNCPHNLPKPSRNGEPGNSRNGPLLGQSRRTVLGLAALFSLDAFAGGFVVQSLLALWLFEKFDLSLATAGLIFSGQACSLRSPTSSQPVLRIELDY